MKYIISRGKDFYCEFVIKEPGVDTPMNVSGMTGTFSMTETGPNPCNILTTGINVVDGPNGIISINLTANQTTPLLGKKGFAEDGYPLIATYTGSLDLMLGNPINVLIPKIYILDDGTVECLA